MNEQDQACYTYEGAIELAVEMENDGFRHYLDAMRRVKDKAARKVLRDAALDELEHKHELEKALLEGHVEGHELEREMPTMDLDYLLKKKELSSGADAREALAYAIHLEKQSLEFYHRMSQACAGAPMGKLFSRIGNDESRHLQSLEDLYEKHFLPEG